MSAPADWLDGRCRIGALCFRPEDARIGDMAGTKERQEDIEQRLKKARDEMKHYKKYDYVIVNDDLNSALSGFGAVVTARRLRSSALDNSWLKKTIFQQEE